MYKLKSKSWKHIVAYFIFDWPSLVFSIGWAKNDKHYFQITVGPFKLIIYFLEIK